MVTQVTPEIRESIDWYLDGLARKWSEALEILEQWDNLDRHDQTVFDAEWPLTVDYLDRLRDWRQQGMFSAEQEHQFQELQRALYKCVPELESALGQGQLMLKPPLD